MALLTPWTLSENSVERELRILFSGKPIADNPCMGFWLQSKHDFPGERGPKDWLKDMSWVIGFLSGIE